MADIKTAEELAPYVSFAPDALISLFAKDAHQHGAILQAVGEIMAAGHDADVALVDEDDWRIILNARANVGETRPEAHRDWHDASLYLTGANAIAVGDRLEGAQEKEPGNGEWRAGTIVNERTIQLKPGDLLFVPAGVPHQNHLEPKTAFAVMKIRAGKEAHSPLARVIKGWSEVVCLENYCEIR